VEDVLRLVGEPAGQDAHEFVSFPESSPGWRI
jgi:hypothetical protein